MNRLMAITDIRKKLNNGGVSIGSWMQIPHSSIAEIMGQSNYDWVAVDMEHGAISVHQLPDLFRALELGNTLPLVRLAHGHSKDCKQALDAGAGGVIVPMIKSADQLRKVRDATRWPPSGNRGVAFSRANLFGKNFNEYIKEAKQPLLIAMIEHIDAINELDDILKVDGLDAILIGPYDLSASMNLTAQFDHPEFAKAIRDIKSKSESANIPCGIHVVSPSVDDLKEKIDDNYRFIAYSIDSVILTNFLRKPEL
ncbi:2,4-dihydroxyhept-2-ene-1,7-dioic acid aldolase [Candidatus Woesearchaeota archaeon]|jgi:2-dehydro-3-deoxyglucarate aldolase|nr:2,4-dihydroxyhept-2-ene-1,7-dioic acid aldolase [Candidatus Woesearchaeota archaeon]